MIGDVKVKQKPQETGDRRKSERSPILTRAKIKVGDREEVVLVWNLNGEGALLSHVDDLPVGTKFTITLMGAEKLSAVVLRETDEHTAVSFEVNAVFKLSLNRHFPDNL